MQDELLSRVIFSPGTLAMDLADHLHLLGHQVTLFTPGVVTTKTTNLTANLSLLKTELNLRGDDELSLLKKHPLTFISLARQIQSELLAEVFTRANNDEFDIVHIYMNEEEQGLSFHRLCNKPVVFTHHDPFNFSTKYRSIMPIYADANWISMSFAQRATMPAITNWLANIYHGLPEDQHTPVAKPTKDYLLFIGRIIESKGVHLAIQAVRQYNKIYGVTMKLKIAGKHYSGQKDTYWQKLQADIDGDTIEYVGFVNKNPAKNDLIANAAALLVPSTFDEPFGMVMIEALAAGTPIIGLDSGAISEVVETNRTGFVTEKILKGKVLDEPSTVSNLVKAIHELPHINRVECRKAFEARFTLSHMALAHVEAYEKLQKITIKGLQEAL